MKSLGPFPILCIRTSNYHHVPSASMFAARLRDRESKYSTEPSKAFLRYYSSTTALTHRFKTSEPVIPISSLPCTVNTLSSSTGTPGRHRSYSTDAIALYRRVRIRLSAQWDGWLRSEERRVGKECRSRWSP